MRVIYIIILFLFSSCANIIAPNGGPKDVIEPEILNKTITLTNEPSTHITLSFQERIQIENNLRAFLMPGLHEAKNIDIKGRDASFTFQHKADTQQYLSIILKGNINDITEQNNFKQNWISVIQPTRPIKIHIKTIWPNKTPENILYYISEFDPEDEKDSSISYQDQWFQTSNQAEITSPTLSKNKYTIVALDDKNGNFKPDSGEWFDYQKVDLTNSPDSIHQTILFPGPDPTITKYDILYYSQHYGAFTFLVYPGGSDYRLVDNNLFTHESFVQIYPGTICDTIMWYNPDADYTVGYFDLYVNHQWFRDLQCTHINNSSIRRPFTIYNNSNKEIKRNTDTIFYTFSNAIRSFDYKKVSISNGKGEPYPHSIFWFNRKNTKAAIVLDSLPTHIDSILITIKDSAIEDVFNQPNQAFTQKMYLRKDSIQEKKGVISCSSPIFNQDSLSLSITIIGPQGTGPFPDYKMYPGSTYSFSNLPEGEYQIMVYKDLNRNGKRDGPWFYGQKQAEPFQCSLPIKVTVDFTVDIGTISIDNFIYR